MSTPISRSAILLVVCVTLFLMPFMMSAVALPATGCEFGATTRSSETRREA